MLVRVRGRSMVPALRPGDILFVQPTPRYHPTRGTIVLVHRRRPPEGRFLKRVVGLPQETVRVENAAVWINDQLLAESYVPMAAALEPKRNQIVALQADEFAVLGDARDDSFDSRSFGPVRPDEIEGVAKWRLWPPTRWGPLVVNE